MNYYEHHLGDWAKKCGHLTMLEEGCYRRLLDWCYAHESPLPLDMAIVRRIARPGNPQERTVLTKVLAEFFEVGPDGYHNKRVDKEVYRYQKKGPIRSENSIKNLLRSELARARRSAVYSALREIGVVPPFNATTAQLDELVTANNLEIPTAEITARHGTTHGTTVTTAVPSHDTARHTARAPVTNSHLSGKPLDALEGTEARVIAVRAMRKNGFSEVNPLDPRFIALVADGVTADEFALTAAEAAAKGKGWAWLLATIKGRREDAKRPQEAPKTARQRAAEATVRDWLPQLASKP